MEQILKNLYIDEDLRISEVARKLGFKDTKVFKLLKKYNIIKSKEQISARKKRTNLLRYGATTPAGNKKVREKMKQTCLEKYGVDNFSKTEKSRERSSNTLKEIWKNPEHLVKIKETSIERFGVDNYSKSEEFRNRLSIMQQKRYKTMQINNSFFTSRPAKIVYNLLIDKFGKEEIIKEYESELYPFKADFYIKSLNLYIEYQGSWVHGKEPFNPKNIKHLELLEKWERKNQELGSTTKKKRNFYSTAIDRWTKSDPLKREIAKKNNLNWKEFFSIREVENWLERF